ncbi:MAG: FAD/NAD(P)-binding protein [Phycisphaeraceae bacterium]|nr:FAD/NAD(P)-binding protein [Phycisphaeraceae bacterium]
MIQARPHCPTIVVIGGGFSGAAVVSHLARSARRPVRVRLFEPSRRLARGIAYSPTGEHLLLNVPASKLSVWPDKPGDFASWCASTGRPVEPGAFLPRAWLGEYAEWTMSSALRECDASVEFDRLAERAVAVRRRTDGALDVLGESGVEVGADQVVLATGHGQTKIPPAFRHLAGDPRLITNPWDESLLSQAARRSERLLLIGVGLTMMDAAISLARAGYTGEIVALSRRGLPSHTHGPSDPALHKEWAAALGGGDLMSLTRAVRERAGSHEWRGVLDSLRPHTARLWRSLSHAERQRFMARLSVYWDAHRHRCPLETAACVALLRDRGVLRVGASTILSVNDRAGRIEVEHREKRSGTVTREAFGAVILCTGPEPDIAKSRSALLESLIDSGEIRRDPLGLGVDCDEHGDAITRGGRPNDRVTLVGPLRRGESWESTAVPEISQQAAAIAPRVLKRLDLTVPIQNAHQPIKEIIR